MSENKHMITVGFDVTWMNVSNSNGGVYHYALMLISALVKYGDVKVVAVIRTPGVGIFDHLSGHESFRVVLLDKASSFLDIVRSERIDVVHTPFQSHENLTLALPMINTLHDLQHAHFPEFFTSEEIARRDVFYKRSSEFSERVIVSYKHVKEDIIRFYGISEKKIDVCPLGMPARRSFDDQTVRGVTERYGLPEQYLFYSANTWRHKNHATLLKALKEVHSRHGIDMPLICTGYQYNDYFPQLQALVDTLQLGGSVRFTGYIPDDDVAVMLQQATLVVIPTLYEAGSFPLMEAMVHGVPVICSNVTSLPETIGDVSYVFDPNDEHQLADKIAAMLNDDDLRQKNREQSQKMVADAGWDRAVPRFLESYARAIDEFSRKPWTNEQLTWMSTYDGLVNSKIEDSQKFESLLKESELDRAARLQAIHELERLLKESEADRAARLEVIHQLEASKVELVRRADALFNELDDLRLQMAAMLSSRSWKITAPLRWLSGLKRKSIRE